LIAVVVRVGLIIEHLREVHRLGLDIGKRVHVHPGFQLLLKSEIASDNDVVDSPPVDARDGLDGRLSFVDECIEVLDISHVSREAERGDESVEFGIGTTGLDGACGHWKSPDCVFKIA